MPRGSAKPCDELKEIAVGIHRGEIFISAQLLDKDQLLQCFTLLNLLDDKQLEDLAKAQPLVLYEYMSHRGPCDLNGHPVFFSFRWLNEEEWAVVREILIRLQDLCLDSKSLYRAPPSS